MRVNWHLVGMMEIEAVGSFSRIYGAKRHGAQQKYDCRMQFYKLVTVLHALGMYNGGHDPSKQDSSTR
jgi:hypothetical protein